MKRLRRDLLLISFDLDDTLIDTEGTARERVGDAVAKVEELFGPLDEAERRRLIAEVVAVDPVVDGRLPTLLRRAGVAVDHPHVAAIRAAYNARLVELLRLLDGATATLEALRGRYRTAIVTNGPLFLQQPKIDRFRLDRLVDHVVISEAVGARKPDPAIFEHACRLAGVAPAAAVHVGDSLYSDVGGAKSAGLAAVWLRPTTYAAVPGEAEPDAVIDRIADLLELLG